MENEETEKPDRWKKWKKVRAKGTWSFVFFSGILGWGMTFGIFLWLFEYFTTKSQFRLELLFEFNWLLFHFGLCILGGFFWGIFVWFFIETAYQRSRKNKDFNIWIPKQTNSPENFD